MLAYRAEGVVIAHAELAELEVVDATVPTPEPARCVRCGKALGPTVSAERLCVLCAATYPTREEWAFHDWRARNGIQLEWRWTPEKGHHAEIPDEIMARWEEERAWQESQKEVEPCPW